MGFLISKWRGIGPRLYLALGFVVALTLISSAVGVYHFERSGDLNYRAESESVPALEASWAAAREAARLRAVGLQLATARGAEAEELQNLAESVIARLGERLAVVRIVPALDADAVAVRPVTRPGVPRRSSRWATGPRNAGARHESSWPLRVTTPRSATSGR